MNYVTDISKLNKLTREQIEEEYENCPIFIIDKTTQIGTWYIIEDSHSSMPLHMLTVEEVDLYNTNEETIESIKLCGVDTEEGVYAMWSSFETDWSAYGYSV